MCPDTWARQGAHGMPGAPGYPSSLLLLKLSLQREGRTGGPGAGEDRETPRHISLPGLPYPCAPDLTVPANPIKFFSAHDKKAVKPGAAMGGQPEVCVTRSPARPPQACPHLQDDEGGGGLQGSE